jgi:hypothetical protein
VAQQALLSPVHDDCSADSSVSSTPSDASSVTVTRPSQYDGVCGWNNATQLTTSY